MAVRPVSVVHDEVSEGLKVSTYYGVRNPKILCFFPTVSFFFSPCLPGAILINETQEIWIQKVDHIIVSMGIHDLIQLTCCFATQSEYYKF